MMTRLQNYKAIRQELNLTRRVSIAVSWIFLGATILFSAGCEHWAKLEVSDLQQPVLINDAIVPVGGEQVPYRCREQRLAASDHVGGAFFFSQNGGYEEFQGKKIRDSAFNTLGEHAGDYIVDCKLSTSGYVWNWLICWWHNARIDAEGDIVNFKPPTIGNNSSMEQ